MRKRLIAQVQSDPQQLSLSHLFSYKYRTTTNWAFEFNPLLTHVRWNEWTLLSLFHATFSPDRHPPPIQFVVIYTSFITHEEEKIPTRRQNIKFDHKISTLFVVHKTTLNHSVTSQYIKILLYRPSSRRDGNCCSPEAVVAVNNGCPERSMDCECCHTTAD